MEMIDSLAAAEKGQEQPLKQTNRGGKPLVEFDQ
jgi:hypothetical protein